MKNHHHHHQHHNDFVKNIKTKLLINENNNDRLGSEYTYFGKQTKPNQFVCIVKHEFVQ
jgi:hypothetical protein